MNYYQQKLWIPAPKLIVPPSGPGGKKVCFYFFSENLNFFDIYNMLEIKKQSVRHYYVPTVTKPPRYFMSQELRKQIMSYKLIPVRAFLGDYTKVENSNFFFDGLEFLNKLDKRFNFSRFNVKRPFNMYKDYISALSGVDKDSFDRTLLYCIDMTKPLPKRVMFRRIYVIYMMLSEWFDAKRKNKNIELPFDKLLLFIFDDKKKRYVKLFDESMGDKNNLNRIRNFLLRLQTQDEEQSNSEDIDKLSNSVAEEEIDDDNTSEKTYTEKDYNINKNEKEIKKEKTEEQNKNIIKQSVSRYLNSGNINSEKALINITDEAYKRNLVTKSLLYNLAGTERDASIMYKKLSARDKKYINKYMTGVKQKILEKEDSVSSARNSIVKFSNVEKLTENFNPSVIINKRKNDFNVNLSNDIINAFLHLERKEGFPLEITSIDVRRNETSPNEIHKTIKNRYIITLKDYKNEEYEAHIDLPHIDDNGTFTINGQKKILINQLLRFPIFFPKIGESRFESAYSVFRVVSKQLKTGAYFILFMGSYKIPLVSYLSYKYGLKDVMKEYGVEYEIID